MIIRLAEESDAGELLKIYAPYVKNTAITFEYDIPDISQFRERIAKTLQRYPYILAEDEEGMAGYAYAGTFKDRKAYDWSVEISIYVEYSRHGRGTGRKLYEKLEKILQAQQIKNLNACIAYADPEDEYLNNRSVAFHEHMGYSQVGHFHKCGYKFGRWYDMIWMEKLIGSHEGKEEDFKPFSELVTDIL